MKLQVLDWQVVMIWRKVSHFAVHRNLELQKKRIGGK